MPILVRHAVSLAVVFALALPLSYYVGQRIYRNLQLNKLEAVDRATFDEGLAYVLTHAGRDNSIFDEVLVQITTLPADRAADLLLTLASAQPSTAPLPESLYDAMGPLIARLPFDQAIGLYDALVKLGSVNADRSAELLLMHLQTKSDAELLAAVDLLDARLLWSRELVPQDKWIAWLAILAQSASELSQYKSARMLGELPDAVDQPVISELLQKLTQSPHDAVRAQCLLASAGYAAIAKEATDYEQIIFTLGQDANKIIARRAWMIVGHLKPFSGFAVNWKEADPFVAEAMLWASVKTNPEDPTPAFEAYASSGVAALGLHALGSSEQEQTLDQLEFELLSTRKTLAMWRILCVLAQTFRPHADTRDWVREQLLWNRREPTGVDPNTPAWNWQDTPGLMLAGEYYAYPGHTKDKLENEFEAARQLADLEGVARLPKDRRSGYTHFGRDETPPLRVIAGAAGLSVVLEKRELTRVLRDNPDLLPLTTTYLIGLAPQQNPQQSVSIETLIRSNEPALLVAAALAAGIRDQNLSLIAGVTADFLRKHPDLTDDQLHAMTDAELANLGLKRVDAIKALLEAAEAAPPSANRSDEAKLLKLALWMRGDLGEDFTPTAEAMLFDKDLPTSTVLMCLLHMKRPIALDYLLGDRVSPPPDLHALLVQERWWHVFRRFVDTSDLTLWLWGDSEAQAFQIEAMRQWYAVNRWRIERGWWPNVD